MLSYGSANRDPRRYDDADTVHVDGKAVHFAFGRGPHRCLGSHLARMELRVGLEEWHRRVPRYRVRDDEVLVYTPGIRDIRYLPLVWD